MSTILVTGGSGSFGRAFVKSALRCGWSRVIVFSRDELKQAQMAAELKPLDPGGALRFFLGDVRDLQRLRRAFEGVHTVVHAAALKRIEVGHYNPMEMVKTNVQGAMNVIEAASDCGVQKVVALSTDKAFQPVSPYGTSKAMAESLFLASNNTRSVNGPRFAVTRYGNVAGSAGSVIPTWRRMLSDGADHVPVTDPDCTRFWMTMDQAVDLVAGTITTMQGGELRIPELPAYRVGDLVEAMGAKPKVIGLDEWEKKHESMCADRCSASARRMTVDELREALAHV